MSTPRPPTVFLGSDPSQHLPKSFPTDGNPAKATGDQSSSPVKTLREAPKVPCRAGSPFKRYRRRYRRRYSETPGGKIIVAQKGGPQLFAIKEIKEPEPLSMIKFESLRQIPHPNFQYVHEIFWAGDTYFTVCNHEAVTLWEIRRCSTLPTEVHISSIASQVNNITLSLIKLIDRLKLFEGVAFLASVGAIHGALTYDNVHLSKDGDVKIGKIPFFVSFQFTEQSVGLTADMKFQRKALLVSPDCQQLQRVILGIMKSGDERDVMTSNHWSPMIKDFVYNLSRIPIPHLRTVSSTGKNRSFLIQAEFFSEVSSK